MNHLFQVWFYRQDSFGCVTIWFGPELGWEALPTRVVNYNYRGRRSGIYPEFRIEEGFLFCLAVEEGDPVGAAFLLSRHEAEMPIYE